MLEYDSLRFRSSPSVDAASLEGSACKEAYSGTSKKRVSHSDFLNCQEDGAPVGTD
jgi:hypothetical protein